MSQRSAGAQSILIESPREYFVDRAEHAFRKLKFEPMPLSRHYLVDLLERFMFASNLFPPDEETGRSRSETLAELYLKAQNAPPPQRQEFWRKLGDISLYISGFFGDSLSRKLVDIDYYVNMGGTAFGALSASVNDEHKAAMFKEYSANFTAFVDVLTFISQDALVQTNEDLLKLYDRYLATGSKLAEEQLLQKGLISADLPRTKSVKN